MGWTLYLVVYPMDQLIVIVGDDGSLEAVVHSANNIMLLIFLLAIHHKSLAPRKLHILINTNKEKQFSFLKYSSKLTNGVYQHISLVVFLYVTQV